MMNPGEQDAINHLIRIMAYSGLAGGAVGLGSAALRNSNPRYNTPEIPKPIIVDMPVPGGANSPTASQVPIPSRTQAVKELPAKQAEDVGLLDKLKQLWDTNTPTFRHPLGPTSPTNATQIPAYYAAIPLAASAGGLAGYAAGSGVGRSVERRRAQSELDDARQEYQNTVNARMADLHGLKAAALADDTVPADPTAARVRDALNLAWVAAPKPAVKVANSAAGGDPGRDASTSSKALMSWLWPGLYMGDTPAKAQAMAVGAAGLLGGVGGYNLVRSRSNADRVRKATEAKDVANAASIPAPVIARLVPMASNA